MKNNQSNRLSSSYLAALRVDEGQIGSKARKKPRRDSPEELLKHKLDLYSRNGDTPKLFVSMMMPNQTMFRFNIHHYYSLLYLCSSSSSDDDDVNSARLAAAMEDPEMAFDLMNQMKGFGLPLKLRSYGPALFGFVKKGNADCAYEVVAHMAECGV
ncbi:Pentacotripeptide-repeat region of PRORP [Dillenia turbinata]|uniref:Pentacotripeptide-repeat region of PRORP n=1 Tax=Dillenia turbinata TaxID=194707 RepID=A0AAN8UI90_9MAGN